MVVGKAAISAPAMCTLYSARSSTTLIRLFRPTVTVWLSNGANTKANRKSFQMLVKDMITTTIKIGRAVGKAMLQKIRNMPAPSMRAALISSPGNPTK